MIVSSNRSEWIGRDEAYCGASNDEDVIAMDEQHYSRPTSYLGA